METIGVVLSVAVAGGVLVFGYRAWRAKKLGQEAARKAADDQAGGVVTPNAAGGPGGPSGPV